MVSRTFFSLLLLLGVTRCVALEGLHPTVEGVVTRVVSSSEFEVNGVPVELEGRTDV